MAARHTRARGAHHAPTLRRTAHAATPRRVSARTARVTAQARPGARGAARRRRHSRLPVLVGVLAALAVVAVVGVVACNLLAPGGDARVAAGQPVTVTIPEGSGAAAISSELREAGVISSDDEFYEELRRQGAEQSLKSGTYSFVTGQDVSEVVAQLVAGPNTSESRLTVAEGLTQARVAQEVEASLGIPAQDFLDQAHASAYVGDYPFLAEAADDSLEGFLYPKTYDFAGRDATADDVIRAMLDQYQAEVVPLDLDAAAKALSATYGVELDGYDVLTLASVIERETVTDEDRPLVASVFYNRLRADMPLQSDATMGYVTGGEVTADDLKQESPYNSYLNKGLPPTPICTPSLASVRAAMEPAQTDYLYFIIIENDGYSNHTFSRTYEEHQAAIDQALADQAAQGQ